MVVSAIKKAAEELGLSLDPASGIFYGYVSGYHVTVVPDYAGNSFELLFSVNRFGNPPAPTDFQPLERGCGPISAIRVTGRRISVVTTPRKRLAKTAVDELKQVLGEALHYLRGNQFTDCCQGCGREDSVMAYYVGGAVSHLCPGCFANASRQITARQQEERDKPENPAAGVVGALLGSLVGGLAIILLSRLGFVSALSGVVMAICTLKGYELLAGKSSTKGLILSIVVMVLMVYISDRVDWAIVAMRDLGLGFLDAFLAIPRLIQASDMTESYVSDLARVYLFTALGAVSTGVRYRRANTVLPNRVYALGAKPQKTNAEQ